MDPPAEITLKPIPTAVDDCARNFLSLAECLRRPTRFADQIGFELVLDEFDRFKLWAGNIAAHRKGRRSMEYRLRDAAQLRAETVDLLTSLSDSLWSAIAIVKEERTPWDEETYSDSDSEDEGDSIHRLQGNTELKQLYASFKSSVTSLMRISMAIREPAPNRHVVSIDKSHFEQHDISHVQAKFPAAPQYLTERLGRAISSRRRYLTYREEHHVKLTKDIDKLGFEAATTEFTTNSTEATNLQRTDSLKIIDEEFDTTSITSYATSINATLRAPALPKDAQEKEHYICPLCYGLVAIHTTASWKRHVYQDLHPYCCTFEDCRTADRLYDSRHDWFAHELEAHHSTFQCIEGCLKVFSTESEFEAHIRTNHDDFATDAVYSALRRTSARRTAWTEMTACMLCEKRMTFRALQKHLGHHQEQLALFALPSNLNDAENDAGEDEHGSLLQKEEGREKEGEEGTDTSEASNTEEMIGIGFERLDHEIDDDEDSDEPFFLDEEDEDSDQPFFLDEEDEENHDFARALKIHNARVGAGRLSKPEEDREREKASYVASNDNNEVLEDEEQELADRDRMMRSYRQQIRPETRKRLWGGREVEAPESNIFHDTLKEQEQAPKLSKLASHFMEMSLQFEKERNREGESSTAAGKPEVTIWDTWTQDRSEMPGLIHQGDPLGSDWADDTEKVRRPKATVEVFSDDPSQSEDSDTSTDRTFEAQRRRPLHRQSLPDHSLNSLSTIAESKE